MLVIAYTKKDCQECERLISLLNNLQWEYIEYTEGEEFSSQQFIDEFGEESEYPQIAVGYQHLGGLKDFLNYYNTLSC